MNEELLAQIDAAFAYKIGDVLTHVGMLPPWTLTRPSYGGKAKTISPQKLIVVERLLQQCHGGIQKHYRCRIVTPSDFEQTAAFARDLFDVGEPELRPYPAPALDEPAGAE